MNKSTISRAIFFLSACTLNIQTIWMLLLLLICATAFLLFVGVRQELLASPRANSLKGF